MLFFILSLSVQYLLTFSKDLPVYRENVDRNNNGMQVIKLGGLFPLSVNENEKCGKLRNTAVERVEAMVFAIQRINENRSVLPGINLTYDIRDSCTLPIRALEESINFVQLSANSLSSSNTSESAVSGVIGPAISDGSVLSASVLRLFQVPQVSYASTAAILSDQSRYEYFFRTIASDSQQVEVIASLIRHFNWTYVFALHSKDTYGTSGVNSLIEELSKGNGSTHVCIAVRQSLPLGTLANNSVFDLAVEEMNRAWVRNASVAILFGHHEEANGMLSAVQRKLVADPNSPLGDLTWIASDSWGLSLNSKFYSIARGMLAVHPMSGTIADFTSYFTNLTPNTTRNPWFGLYWESVFNCSLSGGENPCSIETQKLPKNLTLSPQIPNVVSSVYAFALALDKMLEDICPSGTLCEDVVIQRHNGQAIDGEKLRKYLFNVSLAGLDSFKNDKDILFDHNGDVQQSYMVYNLQLTSKNQLSFRHIATWDHVNLLSVKEEEIKWSNGKVPQSVCSLPCGPGQEPASVHNHPHCCWICKGCLGEFSVSSGNRCHECEVGFLPDVNKSSCTVVPLSYFTWSNPLGIIVAILGSLGTAVCVTTAVAYAIFFNNQLIKASSREHSVILMCGILFCYILPFIFLAKPSPATCAIQRVGSGVSFALIFSALFVKTNRLHRIFNGSPQKLTTLPRFMSPVSQVIITCLLIIVQVAIAAIWLAIEPPQVIETNVNRRTLELICKHNSHATLLTTVLYNLLLLIGSTYFAFRTRKVPENYNEAKFINVTLISLCLVWLAFVPTFYVSIVELSVVYQIFFLLLTIILSASVTMCCLLLPKPFLVVLQKIKQRNGGTLQSSKNTDITKGSSALTSTTFNSK